MLLACGGVEGGLEIGFDFLFGVRESLGIKSSKLLIYEIVYRKRIFKFTFGRKFENQ